MSTVSELGRLAARLQIKQDSRYPEGVYYEHCILVR